jgi:hypothetical protein
MDDKVSEILDGLPPKPPRSRLDPHVTLIEEMRRRGRTYREIAHVLAEACGVKTSPSNIYYFVQLRAREARQLKAAQAKPPSRNVPSAHATVVKPESPANLPADVAQRIAALKNRKPPAEPPRTGFDYDPTEPLRLIDPGKRKPEE